LLSSFQTGDPSWNWESDVIALVGHPVMFLQGTLSDAPAQAFAASHSGIFSWLHPTKTFGGQAATDSAFAAERTKAGKLWMASVAPWFFKRFDAGNNWAQAQNDAIFLDRFQHLLQLRPDFIEITTWNDWGESSYLGPADVTNSCPQCYWSKLDHSGFRAIAAVLIAAYKAARPAWRCLPRTPRACSTAFRVQIRTASRTRCHCRSTGSRWTTRCTSSRC